MTTEQFDKIYALLEKNVTAIGVFLGLGFLALLLIAFVLYIIYFDNCNVKKEKSLRKEYEEKYKTLKNRIDTEYFIKEYLNKHNDLEHPNETTDRL